MYVYVYVYVYLHTYVYVQGVRKVRACEEICRSKREEKGERKETSFIVNIQHGDSRPAVVSIWYDPHDLLQPQKVFDPTTPTAVSLLSMGLHPNFSALPTMFHLQFLVQLAGYLLSSFPKCSR